MSLAPVRFHSEIESTRPLFAEEGLLSFSGWCLDACSDTPPAVRFAVAGRILPLRARHDRKDVPGLFPGHPAAAHCGFRIEGPLPAGVHVGTLEAQLPDGTWGAVRSLSVAVTGPVFRAAVDEPISSGVLCDRVKAGGWALHPDAPIADLFLRYGHREVRCRTGLPRTDVPVLFPDSPQANRAGFETEDFLVAGHGPVRVKARLTDGRVAVATTTLSFSIATDENHGPELDLTGVRAGLEAARGDRPGEPAGQPSPAPRNILFILPGSFAANSALHVSALANELAVCGHSCAVAVTHDLSTLAHHENPSFRGLLHAEAESGVTYPDKRGPDIIHAWTTRENVRRLAESLRVLHGAQLIVHLEDNEQEVLSHAVGRSPDELAHMDDTELDRLVPPELSHPHRSRTFLAAANGVTIITGRLREFVPADRPCHTVWPAADRRYFYPRPKPGPFRRALDTKADETVLFYHGNVHAANAAEMRELYMAVLQLNRTGHPATLIRTGLDAVDFLGDLAREVSPHVLALGQILHHRHLAPLMALADFFVQPGAADAFNDYRFPSKLPEFFSLGRPVILPRANLGEVVRHGVDAWVLERADATGIAAAVRILRADPALAERLSQGALSFAEEHFNWQRSAEALARFYQSLAPSCTDAG